MTMTHLELPLNFKLVFRLYRKGKYFDFNFKKKVLLKNIQEKLEIIENAQTD